MTLIERSTVRVHFQRLRAALQRSEFGLKCFAAYTVVLRLSAPLPGGDTYVNVVVLAYISAI